MCSRTDCAGSWAGPMACAVCRERDMGEMQSCLAGGTHKTADIRADVAEWRRRRADHGSSCTCPVCRAEAKVEAQ